MTYGQRQKALPLEAGMVVMSEVQGIHRFAIAVQSQ
jgi:hypothetical protein